MSKLNQEGEFTLSHRNSPGLTEEQAVRMNLPPRFVREGAVLRGATLWCPHCGGCWVKNPLRERPRNHCWQCGMRYVCDGCAYEMQKPDYVHRTIYELMDMLKSGKWRIAGGTASAPILVPVHSEGDING